MERTNHKMEAIELSLIRDKQRNVRSDNILLVVTAVFFLLSCVVPNDYVSERNRIFFFFVPSACIYCYLGYSKVLIANYEIYGSIVLEKDIINIFITQDNSTILLSAPIEIHIIDYESIVFGARTLYRISGVLNYVSSKEGKFFFLLQSKKEFSNLKRFLDNHTNRDKFIVHD